jgi:hypothetical protein
MKEPFIVNNPTAYGSGTSAAAYGTGSAGTTFGSGATATTVVYKTLCLTGGTIRALVANILVATTSTTDVVFTCTVNPTPGSATNARTVGTLTVTGDSVGDIWQRFTGLTNTSVNPGEEVAIALTTKGSAATTANGFVSAVIEPVFVGKIAERDIDRAKPYGSNAVGTINTVVA